MHETGVADTPAVTVGLAVTIGVGVTDMLIATNTMYTLCIRIIYSFFNSSFQLI